MSKLDLDHLESLAWAATNRGLRLMSVDPVDYLAMCRKLRELRQQRAALASAAKVAGSRDPAIAAWLDAQCGGDWREWAEGGDE